jgi:hypothetical protein
MRVCDPLMIFLQESFLVVPRTNTHPHKNVPHMPKPLPFSSLTKRQKGHKNHANTDTFPNRVTTKKENKMYPCITMYFQLIQSSSQLIYNGARTNAVSPQKPAIKSAEIAKASYGLHNHKMARI